MRLFGSYTSPFVRHCRIVLSETGLAYEFIETDLAGSAEKSPTKRVPFLEDGDQFFTDSSSIIKYLREKSGQHFCASPQEFDEFCIVNTALDATINLFFMSRDGVQVADVPYLQRQAARVESIISELNEMTLPMRPPYNDAQLRLACFIGWAKFRKRFDFTQYGNVEDFFVSMEGYENFKVTAPDI